ncbi:MAG: DUF2934 domain-containing protein [Rhodospirillales bacterium]|nr:DUF2934 domain-containing protein [Rhodospirillales bacterium]
MDTQMDIRIRSLAHPLWESAARPYGMALDFWLMAEQMIFEMLSASARLANAATGDNADPEGGQAPNKAIERVQELAHCMWDNAGRQYELALDCWMSAEQHALALNRATKAAREGTRELAALPAPAYLEHIRRKAYFLWESTGQQYGNALDYWLQAEQQVLQAMADATALIEPEAKPTASGDPVAAGAA